MILIYFEESFNLAKFLILASLFKIRNKNIRIKI
jgi:hypothetical protein